MRVVAVRRGPGRRRDRGSNSPRAICRPGCGHRSSTIFRFLFPLLFVSEAGLSPSSPRPLTMNRSARLSRRASLSVGLKSCGPVVVIMFLTTASSPATFDREAVERRERHDDLRPGMVLRPAVVARAATGRGARRSSPEVRPPHPRVPCGQFVRRDVMTCPTLARDNFVKPYPIFTHVPVRRTSALCGKWHVQLAGSLGDQCPGSIRDRDALGGARAFAARSGSPGSVIAATPAAVGHVRT